MTLHDRLASPTSPEWPETLRSIASVCLQGVAAFVSGWARAVSALVPPWRPILPKALHPPPLAEFDAADAFAPTMPCAFYESNGSAADEAIGAHVRGGAPQLPA